MLLDLQWNNLTKGNELVKTCLPPTHTFLCFSIALLKKGNFTFFSVMWLGQIFILIATLWGGKHTKKIKCTIKPVKGPSSFFFLMLILSGWATFFHSQSTVIQQLFYTEKSNIRLPPLTPVQPLNTQSEIRLEPKSDPVPLLNVKSLFRLPSHSE